MLSRSETTHGSPLETVLMTGLSLQNNLSMSVRSTCSMSLIVSKQLANKDDNVFTHSCGKSSYVKTFPMIGWIGLIGHSVVCFVMKKKKKKKRKKLGKIIEIS